MQGKQANLLIDEIPTSPCRSLLPLRSSAFWAGEEGEDLQGWWKEEGVGCDETAGRSPGKPRDLGAWEVQAIWLNRVKLSVGSLALPKEQQNGVGIAPGNSSFSGSRWLPSLSHLSIPYAAAGAQKAAGSRGWDH